MNTRLKIICILFGIAYLFIIGDTIVQLFSVDFLGGHNIGNSYELGYEFGKRIHDSVGISPLWGIFLPGTAAGILSLIVLGLFIYIPIQTYKIIRSIVSDNIFDNENIKRIQRIGYSLLIAFVICLPLYPLIQHFYFAFYGISDISQIGSIRNDYSLLLFGLLVLLFAEILKISLSIKEENDLTV